MGRTWQFLSLLLLGIGFAWAIQYYLKSSQQEAKELAPPPARIKVVALGRIQPESGILDVNGKAGERILALEVSEGDQVKKGDVLAILDTQPVALANLDYVKSQLEGGRMQQAAKLAASKALLNQAQVDLENLEEKNRFDLEESKNRIVKISGKISDAESQIDRMKVLVNKGAMARIELDRKTEELNEQKRLLEDANIDLERLKNLQKMARINAESNLDIKRANSALDQASIDTDSLEKKVALEEANLSNAFITAPEDGLVLSIYHRPGEAIGSEPVLKMANLDSMIVMTEVYETDIHLVKVGQKATATSPALEHEITGSVVSIGRMVVQQGIYSSDPSISTDARVIDVIIRLDQPELVNQLVNLQVQVSIRFADGQESPPSVESASGSSQ